MDDAQVRRARDVTDLLWFIGVSDEIGTDEQCAIWNLYQLGIIYGPDPQFNDAARSDYTLTHAGQFTVEMCSEAWRIGMQEWGGNPFEGPADSLGLYRVAKEKPADADADADARRKAGREAY